MFPRELSYIKNMAQVKEVKAKESILSRDIASSFLRREFDKCYIQGKSHSKSSPSTYFVNSAKPSTQDYSCLKCLGWHHLYHESLPIFLQPALMDVLGSQL